MHVPFIYQVCLKYFNHDSRYRLNHLADICLDNFGSTDNPTSSNYTAFSHDASTFPATSTVTSGLINENEIQGNHILPTHSTMAGMFLLYSLILGFALNDTRCKCNHV